MTELKDEFNKLSDIFHCSFQIKDYLIGIPGISNHIKVTLIFKKYTNLIEATANITMYHHDDNNNLVVVDVCSDSTESVLEMVARQIMNNYNNGYTILKKQA